MNKTINKTITKHWQPSVKNKLIIFSAAVILSVFILGSIAFVFLMELNFVSNAGNQLIRNIEIEQIKLEASVESEIAIVLRMANSPLIKRYFANPDDAVLEQKAFEEFEVYREAFVSQTVFWINDIDMIFYFSDGVPYVVDPYDPVNYWYFLTTRETEVYNFNINFNPDMDMIMLWVNAPVFDENNNAIGMVGCGINLTEFINTLYSGYTDTAELLFFNAFGEITGAREMFYVENKIPLDEKLGQAGTEILNKAKTIKPGEFTYFELYAVSGVGVVGTVPSLDWYMAAVQTFSFGDSLRNGMTVLFAVMAAVMLVIIVIFNTFAIRLLRESESAKRKTEIANDKIMESINYASKIQRNLLPDKNVMENAFHDYSVIWKPRDIVGGDIYWLKQFDEGSVLCVADCTGHGTPGALLTMLAVSAFESVIKPSNCHDTANAVWLIDQRLASVLNVKSDASNMDIKDGCDLAVLFIAKDGGVTLSTGNTDVFVCDGKKVTRYKGQRIFVGEGKLKSKDDVKTLTVAPNDGNKFYIASDGLYDQVGGSENVPYGYAEFERIILENHNQSQNAISNKVWEAFETYRGENKRRDDMELISFKPLIKTE
jgi:serine phosphatase RsbU (regulator of sigma subunit)